MSKILKFSISFNLVFILSATFWANEQTAMQKADKLRAEGVKLYQQKNDADAIKKYEEALKLDDSFYETYYYYGNSLCQKTYI